MSIQGLTDRAIQGMFYENLENAAAPWFAPLAMRVDSDQRSEEYKWLGQVPQMREWIGGRHAKGLRDNGFTIENKTFESTLELPADDVRRDKTGQVEVRVADLAERAANHPVKLLSELIVAGTNSVCYDGQYFFDTDHAEGASGTQSNDISVDISGLPTGADFHGSVAKPSAEEMNLAILEGIQQMYGFKDDQGEPMNELATNFIVMVPVPYWQAARAAVNSTNLRLGTENTLQGDGLNVQVYANPRISWTDKFAIFTPDGRAKPFIHQVEMETQMQTPLTEGSEHATIKNTFLYPVKGIHNVGYGLWQKACLVTLT